MKYHWIDISQNQNAKNIELTLPDRFINTSIDTNLNYGEKGDTDAEDFQIQLIKAKDATSLIANMTKDQLKESCLQLSKKAEVDKILLQLAVGDCVISNFKEPYQESNLDETHLRSTNNRQIQIREKNILNKCQRIVDQMKYSNELERQLLIGICISDNVF